MSGPQQELPSAIKALMQAMGSPRGAFDPMPPSQIAALMDIDRPPEIRALGYAYWKTVHPQPSGKGYKRSHIVRDERGPLEIKHFAEYFDWPISMASRVYAKLAQWGCVFKDEKGRIHLNGDMAAPRIRANGEEKENERNNPLCTDNLPDDMLQFFQSLPVSVRTMVTQDVGSIEEWGDQALAQTAAQVRAAKTDLLVSYFEVLGFRREKPKGRPRKQVKTPQPLAVQIELKALPNLSVQISKFPLNGHSAQNGNPSSEHNQNDAVHNGASLSALDDQNSESEVNPVSVENNTTEQEKEAAQTPAPRPSGLDETLPVEVEKLNAIRAALENSFGRKLRISDTLPAQFLELARQLGLPARALLTWMDEKMSSRKGMGYHVSSPGALLGFAAQDLPQWIELNRTLLSNMAIAEEREATARMHREGRGAAASAGGEPFEWSNEINELARKKGMS